MTLQIDDFHKKFKDEVLTILSSAESIDEAVFNRQLVKKPYNMTLSQLINEEAFKPGGGFNPAVIGNKVTLDLDRMQGQVKSCQLSDLSSFEQVIMESVIFESVGRFTEKSVVPLLLQDLDEADLNVISQANGGTMPPVVFEKSNNKQTVIDLMRETLQSTLKFSLQPKIESVQNELADIKSHIKHWMSRPPNTLKTQLSILCQDLTFLSMVLERCEGTTDKKEDLEFDIQKLKQLIMPVMMHGNFEHMTLDSNKNLVFKEGDAELNVNLKKQIKIRHEVEKETLQAPRGGVVTRQYKENLNVLFAAPAQNMGKTREAERALRPIRVN